MKVTFYCLSLFLIILLSACSHLGKSNPNSISIEIKGDVQPDSIKLVSFNNSEGLIAKNGNPYVFNFGNAIHDAYVIDVFKNGKTDSKKLFLDGEALKIKAELTPEAFKIDTVMGSKTYNKSIKFYSTLDSLKNNKVNDFEINQFLLESVEENISHPFSFEISNHFIDRNKNYKARLIQLKTILDQQPETLKANTLSVHRTLKDLVKNEYIDLTAFQFYNRSGKVSKIDLSHKGDYILDFWFVHCPPCVRDHKKIITQLDLFSSNDLELIGISIDTEPEKWLNYLENHQYNWQNFRELRNGNDLVDALNVWEFPTYILINNSGEIKTKFYAFEEIENYFNKL